MNPVWLLVRQRIKSAHRFKVRSSFQESSFDFVYLRISVDSVSSFSIFVRFFLYLSLSPSLAHLRPDRQLMTWQFAFIRTQTVRIDEIAYVFNSQTSNTQKGNKVICFPFHSVCAFLSMLSSKRLWVCIFVYFIMSRRFSLFRMFVASNSLPFSLSLVRLFQFHERQ